MVTYIAGLDCPVLSCNAGEATPLLLDFLNRRPVLFVGAGISRASGLPLQNPLKALVIDLLATEQLTPVSRLYHKNGEMWKSRTDQVMMEAVIQVITRYESSYPIDIARVFGGGVPTGYHRGIAALLLRSKLSAVITPNFDELIETAFRQMTGAEIESPLAVIASEQNWREMKVDDCKIFKVHGTASSSETMVLTLQQAGKGLEKWKAEVLISLSSQPFVFIGYSDRDKDITPVLGRIKNEWLWFFHSGQPIESQIEKGSHLETLLARDERIGVLTDSGECFRQAVAALGMELQEAPSVAIHSWGEDLASSCPEIGSRTPAFG